MSRFPLHTGLTIATLGLLLAGARLVTPAIKGPERAQFTTIFDFAPERVPLSPLIRRPEPEPPPVPRIKAKEVSPLLEDSGGAMDHFYQSLWRTEKRDNHGI